MSSDKASGFSSRRERLLWLWTVATVAAIYATLGLTGTLSSFLRDRNLLDNTFFGTFLVMVVAVALIGLRVRPNGAEIGIVLGIGAVYLMVFLRMGIPEERTHLIEYSIVAVLIHQALLERKANGRSVRSPAILAFVVTALIGWLDEGIQALLPSRVYDNIDVGFNALAAFMAVGGSVLLTRARDWRTNASEPR